MSQILHVGKDDFEQQVLQAQGKVLVDFWAEWCGPCRMLGPVLEQVAGEDHPGVTIAKVNVDEQPDLAQRYGVMSIPALKVFENGQIVAEQVGAVPRSHVLDLLGL